MALVDVDGCKVETAQIELVHHFQGGQQILVLGGCIFVIVDGLDIGQHLLDATHHEVGVKAALLASAVEVGRIEGQGMINLEPGDAESHHAVGHGVGLGEQILDLLAGANVPIRHAGGHHFLLRTGRQTPALTDGLHDLEGPLVRHTAGDEVEHNIVTGTDGLVHRGGLGVDEVLGVAQPHIGTVGIATDPHQEVELLRQGIQQNATGEAGIEFRNTHCAGGAQELVVLIAQDLGAGENGHGTLVIQGNGFGIHAGHVLHHADHGGVIMAQHIQLQQILLHGVVFKMGGDLIGIGIIGRMLHWAEVPNLIFLGNNNQTAGVLSRSTAHTHTAGSQAGFFGLGGGLITLLQVLFYIAESGFLRHGADGTGTEHMGRAEHGNTVLMSLRLIFTGEIQVNIRHLIAAEAQKGLEGDVEAVLFQLGATDRAVHVRKIRAAVEFLGHIQNGVLAVFVGAAVMRREGVNFRNAGHEGHDGRADRATGTHQVAVFQAVLHQSLGGHIDDIVMTGNDVMQLSFHAIHEHFRRIFAIKSV